MDSLKKLPHWVWYVGGGVVGLVVLFLIASRASSSSSGTAATVTPDTSGSASTSTEDSQTLDEIQGELSQQTSAYEGLTSELQNLQSGSSSTGSGSTSTGSETELTVGGANGEAGQGIWANHVAAYTSPEAYAQNPQDYIALPFGEYTANGSPVAGGGAAGGFDPISYQGGTLYVEGQNVSGQTTTGTGTGS